MNLTDKSSKTENLGLLKRIFEISDNTAPRLNSHFNLDDVRLGDTEKIRENTEILKEVLENAETQGVSNLDVSGFLTKNVNMK